MRIKIPGSTSALGELPEGIVTEVVTLAKAAGLSLTASQKVLEASGQSSQVDSFFGALQKSPTLSYLIDHIEVSEATTCEAVEAAADSLLAGERVRQAVLESGSDNADDEQAFQDRLDALRIRLGVNRLPEKRIEEERRRFFRGIGKPLPARITGSGSMVPEWESRSGEFYIVTKADVGKRTIRAFGSVWPLLAVLDQVQEIDIGKRIYLVNGILQVENDDQLKARLAKGA